MQTEINEVLQNYTAAVVAVASAFLIRYSRRNQNAWAGIGFTISIFCYLISYSNIFHTYFLIHFIIATGAISIPIFFWLFAKAVFDDHFKPTWYVSLWFLVQLTPRYIQIYLTNPTDLVHSYLHLISEVISIGFIMAGLYTTLKTKNADLIDERIRFRNLFIFISATIIGLTLIIEIATFGKEAPLILLILQRASILILALYFLLKNFEVRPGFFFKDRPKQKVIAGEDHVLQSKLLSMLEEQKVYRKEGLTIGELAELMHEQEYKLRRMINGQLGFKNFNDFLNHYRIAQACEILSDPTQNRKTILEISYELGYQSLGPFNKAFKEKNRSTPTAFRKTSQNA